MTKKVMADQMKEMTIDEAEMKGKLPMKYGDNFLEKVMVMKG